MKSVNMTSKDNNFITCKFTAKEKIIDFDEQEIQRFPKDELCEIARYLKKAFQIEKCSDGSPKMIIVSEKEIKYLTKWLNTAVIKLQECNAEQLDIIIEILRSLRNCCTNLQTQNYIMHDPNLLNSTDILFSKLNQMNKSNMCLKILLQFLVNLTSSNNSATEIVCDTFYQRLEKCLIDGICIYEASALIYNISLIASLSNIELVNIILEIYHSDNYNEYLTFYLQNSITNISFWYMYDGLEVKYRITILEILKEIQHDRKEYFLPDLGLNILVNIFLKSDNIVFQVSEQADNHLRVYEVSLVLEILSSLSSGEVHLQKLQRNKDILINGGVLLINIHRLGKASENCFTPVQKLSEFKENSELRDHPAFGFKADLVRLIGNLCWKNTELQNLARTAELIPVILDCCNMDARNPFIIQWAILAVRNLCDNNLENQKVIAGLHQDGTVTSEVLDELGITLHSDGDKQLKIMTLESLKK